jgi:hypothetical protein
MHHRVARKGYRSVTSVEVAINTVSAVGARSRRGKRSLIHLALHRFEFEAGCANGPVPAATGLRIENDV